MSEPAGYLHGFTEAEQQRLLEQADFLAPWVYAGLSLPPGPVLEIGAGVGAQTRHLMRLTREPITTVEFSPRQLQAQRQVLARELADGRVRAVRGDARAMPLASDCFSSAFLCWVLEHVPGPEAVLHDALRVLEPGGVLWATEVQNQSFTLLPRDPELYRFWDLLNQTQLGFGGDPFVGARLGALLQASGYTDISIRFVPVQGDARDPVRRAAILDYFHKLLLSSVESVVSSHGGTEEGWRAVLDRAFARARAVPDSVFLYTFAQASARKPERP